MAAGCGLRALSGRKSMPRAGSWEGRRGGRRRVWMCELDEGTAGVVRLPDGQLAELALDQIAVAKAAQYVTGAAARGPREMPGAIQHRCRGSPSCSARQGTPATPARLRKGPSRAVAARAKPRPRPSGPLPLRRATAGWHALLRSSKRDDRWRGSRAPAAAHVQAGLPKTGPRTRSAAHRPASSPPAVAAMLFRFQPDPHRIGHNRICCCSPDMEPRVERTAARALPPTKARQHRIVLLRSCPNSPSSGRGAGKQSAATRCSSGCLAKDVCQSARLAISFAARTSRLDKRGAALWVPDDETWQVTGRRRIMKKGSSRAATSSAGGIAGSLPNNVATHQEKGPLRPRRAAERSECPRSFRRAQQHVVIAGGRLRQRRWQRDTDTPQGDGQRSRTRLLGLERGLCAERSVRRWAWWTGTARHQGGSGQLETALGGGRSRAQSRLGPAERAVETPTLIGEPSVIFGSTHLEAGEPAQLGWAGPADKGSSVQGAPACASRACLGLATSQTALRRARRDARKPV